MVANALHKLSLRRLSQDVITQFPHIAHEMSETTYDKRRIREQRFQNERDMQP